MGFRRFVATAALTPCLAAAQGPPSATDFTSSRTVSPLASSAACSGAGVGAADDTYELCALRYDGGVVRQGATGLVVARAGAFRGFALTPLVAGDSALAYARLFDRQALRSREFSVAAGATMIGGAFLLFSHHGSGDHGEYRPNNRVPLALTFQAVGFALTIPARVYARHASQSLSASLWWNNSRFAR